MCAASASWMTLQERKVKNKSKQKRVETTNFWVGLFFASLLLVNIGEPSKRLPGSWPVIR